MLDIATTSVLIAAVSVVIATMFSALALRNDTRARQAQLYLEVFDKLNTKDFIRTWNEVMYHQDFETAEEWTKKYGPVANLEAAVKLFSVGMLYQTIGMLVRENLIDPSLVFRENPWAAAETWQKLEPVVKGIRETADPRFWESFEYLANQVAKHRQQMDTGTD